MNVGCGWAAGTWKQIPSCRIVCKEVVEALSKIRNLIFADLGSPN